SNWTPLTDNQPSLAIGAIAAVPHSGTTADTIYAGTGDGNLSCDSEFGQGVLKSTDNGATWSLLGNGYIDPLSVTSIAVTPGTSPATDVIYAGTAYGTSNSTTEACITVAALSSLPGLFKSTDGGA